MGVLVFVNGDLIVSEDNIMAIIILLCREKPNWYDELRKKGDVNLSERHISNEVFPQILEEFKKNISIKEGIINVSF